MKTGNNPSKITGGKGREETVKKETPAFMGQPHRAASDLSRRRSCYSLRLPGACLELLVGRGGPKSRGAVVFPVLFLLFVLVLFLFQKKD